MRNLESLLLLRCFRFQLSGLLHLEVVLYEE